MKATSDHDESQKIENKKSIPLRNGFEIILRINMNWAIFWTYQTRYEVGHFFYYSFFVDSHDGDADKTNYKKWKIKKVSHFVTNLRLY